MLSQKQWNEKVRQYAPAFGGFLQLWEWGEVQRLSGLCVERKYDDLSSGEVLAQGIFHPITKTKGFWFFPKGPLGSANPHDAISWLSREFSGGVWLQTEPASRERTWGSRSQERHPSHTAIIDLSTGYENILSSMKPKTRYNIKLGERKGVHVSFETRDALPRFLRLMQETAKRDGFSAHTPERYAAILEACTTNDCRAFLACATYNGEDVAMNLMIDALGTRTYLHGASSSKFRDVMGPYVLHAALLRDACERGMTQYDFWGIAPEGASEHHAWQGITRFKLGFGARRVEMPGTYTLVIHHGWRILYVTAKSIVRFGRKVMHR